MKLKKGRFAVAKRSLKQENFQINKNKRMESVLTRRDLWLNPLAVMFFGALSLIWVEYNSHDVEALSRPAAHAIRVTASIQPPSFPQQDIYPEAGAQKARGTRKKQSMIARINTFDSISDFKSLDLPESARKLITQMEQDEFNEGHPFYAITNIFPVAKVLDKGVVNFQRQAYRTSEFVMGSGYDLVKYEILHPDNQKSHIVAFKQRTAPGQNPVGRPDQRPTFTLIVVPQDNGLVHSSLYYNGMLQTTDSLSMEQAMSEISEKLRRSTPWLAMR